MTLNAPTKLIVLLSLIVAVVAALAALGIFSFLPVPAVWTMAVAYLLLLAGCVFKGV